MSKFAKDFSSQDNAEVTSAEPGWASRGRWGIDYRIGDLKTATGGPIMTRLRTLYITAALFI